MLEVYEIKLDLPLLRSLQKLRGHPTIGIRKGKEIFILANSVKSHISVSTMNIRQFSRAVLLSKRVYAPPFSRYFSHLGASCLEGSKQKDSPQALGDKPPGIFSKALKPSQSESESSSFLGTSRMPEFNLKNKVVIVSGAARGLGIIQAEALLEAGAIVYALDRLSEPSPYFFRVQKRAAEELDTSLSYRQIDVRDVKGLNKIVEDIGKAHSRVDGLIAAAGIQQETTALDYTAKDANLMFEINTTGVFMTAQAVAKQMIRYEKSGSIVLIASMSATIANRVSGFLEI